MEQFLPMDKQGAEKVFLCKVIHFFFSILIILKKRYFKSEKYKLIMKNYGI